MIIRFTLFLLFFGMMHSVNAHHGDQKLIIGLDADLSGPTKIAGESIRRGIEIALEKINKNGGFLGHEAIIKPLDHRSNPARGIDNLGQLSANKDLLAVVGGVHTPVALAQLPIIHRKKILYLGAWAAGTPIVANDYDPNFVYRVSVRDEYAGKFLLEKASSKGHSKVALLLEQTGWGRSNEKAIMSAASEALASIEVVSWFHWGEQHFGKNLQTIASSGAEAIIFVGNAPEGSALVKAMARLPENERLDIVSHWGISAGQFFEHNKSDLAKINFTFLQSFSFSFPNNADKASDIQSYYCETWGAACDEIAEIAAPVGLANAFDLMYLLHLAVQQAKSVDPVKVRGALENLSAHDGLIKQYAPAFTPEMHDALTAEEFFLAKYNEFGHIVPSE